MSDISVNIIFSTVSRPLQSGNISSDAHPHFYEFHFSSVPVTCSAYPILMYRITPTIFCETRILFNDPKLLTPYIPSSELMSIFHCLSNSKDSAKVSGRV